MINKEERRYDMDWIRDINVLLIIFFHSLIIFFTRESSIMFVRSQYNSQFCIILEAVLGRIMMPILFMLAGFSVTFSLEKRTPYEFILNRTKKLLLPFLIGSLTLNPIVSYMYGLSQGRTISFDEHYFKFVTSISEGLNGLTTGYSPMHFWFLLYLFIFSLICFPLFITRKNKKIVENENSFWSIPGILLLTVIPYTAIFAINILDEMNPIGYLFLFLFGYIVLPKNEVRQAIKRDKWIYLFFAILMILGSLIGWFVITDYNNIGLDILFAFCNKGSRIIAPITVIAFCDNPVINKKSNVLLYLNKANFFIYIFHMIVLTSVGYLVLSTPFNGVVKFLLINIITYAITFLLYEIYRRSKDRIGVGKKDGCKVTRRQNK